MVIKYTFYIQRVLKLKINNSGAKTLRKYTLYTGYAKNKKKK